MVGVFILSKKEKKTELRKMVFSSRRLLELDDLRMNWIVLLKKILVCDDYIAFFVQ